MKTKRPKVYLESTIISYLAARPSTDLLVLAKQHLTVMWWNGVLPKVEAYLSAFVLEEIEKGDKKAASKRLEFCKGISILQKSREITPLARAYLAKTKIPTRAEADAFHIACATIYGMDFLLTWNCTHIANAFVRRKIEEINMKEGYETPVICTPEELWEVK